MPQNSIEYSGNLGTSFNPRSFARQVHDHLVEEAKADPASCKTRLVELKDVVIGDGSDRNAMIHVVLRILPGRSEEQKRRLGEAVLNSLREEVRSLEHFDLQLSVEVRELGGHYRKVRLQL